VKGTPSKPGRKPYRFRWKIFLSGLAAIVVGYIFLARGDITAAPLLLVLGYCVLVPVSLL